MSTKAGKLKSDLLSKAAPYLLSYTLRSLRRSRMVARDAYQTLGVTRTSTQDEIKNAYRHLAKKHHPDLNPGNKEAESKFKDISEAYERLGTPENRAKYDRGEFEEVHPGSAGTEGYSRSGRGPFYRHTQESGQRGGRYTYSFGNGGSEEDLFQSIFGGMRGQGGQEGVRLRGEDQLYRIDIDLKDAVLGAEKELILASGKRLAIKIPSGVTDGVRLKFSGEGAPGVHGGPHGDAYFEIHIREDQRFKREGENLILELPVSITEAVFGGEIRTPTIDGEVMLKIPPGSNSGKKLKLTGKGIYNQRTHRRGDQIVILKVMLPEKIDSDLESALRTWQSKHSYNPRERWAA